MWRGSRRSNTTGAFHSAFQSELRACEPSRENCSRLRQELNMISENLHGCGCARFLSRSNATFPALFSFCSRSRSRAPCTTQCALECIIYYNADKWCYLCGLGQCCDAAMRRCTDRIGKRRRFLCKSNVFAAATGCV